MGWKIYNKKVADLGSHVMQVVLRDGLTAMSLYLYIALVDLISCLLCSGTSPDMPCNGHSLTDNMHAEWAGNAG